MPAERLLDSDAEDLVALAREIARDELAPRAAAAEEAEQFPREQFHLLGKSGLLGLPYPERWGGSEVSYEVYLQVLEEIAAAWMTVGVGLSVHTMSCYALAEYGTDSQRAEWLPEMLEGSLLGAYALSETQATTSSTARRRGSRTRGWRTSTRRWSGRARRRSRACWCPAPPTGSRRLLASGRWDSPGRRRPS
jgi:alkylation response protein AidB-like acyl-CoA dehydrogenase